MGFVLIIAAVGCFIVAGAQSRSRRRPFYTEAELAQIRYLQQVVADGRAHQARR